MLDTRNLPLYLRRGVAMQLLGVGKRVFRKLTSGPNPRLRPLHLGPETRALFARRDIEALIQTGDRKAEAGN
jgi:hypothetical protein